MDRKELNKMVSTFLGPEIIGGLKHFVQKIDSEQADILILIARKSLCLFNLLDYIGIPKPHGEIVSDRVLDLSPHYFKDKKVIVVDDTLILGTTLKNIKTKLIKYECNVKIYAFCVDNDNWQKNLIIPNHVEYLYPSSRVLLFCDKLVKAFAMVGLPYLVDFPITKLYSIPKEIFKRILQDEKNLTCVKLSVNQYNHTELYTVLLKDNIKQQFYI